MKLVDLVSLAAELTGLPETTLGETARSLQKAGLIQTGKPGRYGGAKMNASDAASLTIALLGAGERRQVTAAHSTVEYLSAMRAQNYYALGSPNGSPPLEGEDPNLNFKIWPISLDLNFHEYIAEMIKNPSPDVPEPFAMLGYHVSVLNPPEVGVVTIATRNVNKTRDDFEFERRTIEIMFLHPSLGGGTPDHVVLLNGEGASTYVTSRLLRERYFHAMHAALYADELSGGER